ncbi:MULTISPECIES: EAL domain-containing protein [Serratia]|uniref:EAL domain-containing protein n=1 Tax=Serratia TaxID=613 RepID=UPI001F4C4F0B|nr:MULTISPECIES: EAL domain-containing protein [Serratia]ULG14092.1 Spa19 [Serratia proteamaculans]ULG17415.1 Spa19 [Serratia proteamaculans]CAI1209370.1 phage resistance protein [Serratia quinivorans]CAI1220334.1 phage resistance protein [Serratia quinivorans]CAI2159576.1 phage resistance protein [Serratia quinivorans]
MVYKRYSYFRLFVTLAVLAIVTLSIVLTASRKISASVERDIYRRPPLAIVQFDETFELAQRTIMLDDRPRRTLHLRVDDIELDEAGNVTTVARENYIERQLFSSRYPYSVTAVATQFSQAPLIGDYVGVSLALLPVLAIIAGITTLRMVWRITSPLAQLRRALRKQQFMPYFQPIVRGGSGELTGAEVLVRWQHPKMGVLSPANFIALAEESGLIVPMTRDLMAQVRECFSPLANRLPGDFHFGFNISAYHFNDINLIDDCRDFLKAFGLHRVKLVLELTERQVLVSNELTIRIIQSLHQLGVLIALDDFGTGYSSLSYLQDHQIDILKIDRRFISQIGADTLSCHIVDHLLSLAECLDITTVAEGVETEAQRAYLCQRQSVHLQGYLFGRPESQDLFLHQWMGGLPF